MLHYYNFWYRYQKKIVRLVIEQKFRGYSLKKIKVLWRTNLEQICIKKSILDDWVFRSGQWFGTGITHNSKF